MANSFSVYETNISQSAIYHIQDIFILMLLDRFRCDRQASRGFNKRDDGFYCKECMYLNLYDIWTNFITCWALSHPLTFSARNNQRAVILPYCLGNKAAKRGKIKIVLEFGVQNSPYCSVFTSNLYIYVHMRRHRHLIFIRISDRGCIHVSSVFPKRNKDICINIQNKRTAYKNGD